MSSQLRLRAARQPLAFGGQASPKDLPVRQESEFSVRVSTESCRTVVTPIGELDLATVDEFDCALWDAQRRARSMVIDLRALTFIDCAGTRSLAGAQLRASSWQHHLEVICAGGQVERLLTLTGLGQFVNVISPPPALKLVPAHATIATTSA